jgi:hypothetical protein
MSDIGRPPEYLHVPAPRTQYVSEYGHLLRIASVHGRLEETLNTAGSKSYCRVWHVFTHFRHSHSPPHRA